MLDSEDLVGDSCATGFASARLAGKPDDFEALTEPVALKCCHRLGAGVLVSRPYSFIGRSNQ